MKLSQHQHDILHELGIPVYEERSTVIAPPNLTTLKTTVSHCTQCELCKTRTQTVFGVGHPNAKILFIGEAPGQHEDLRGEPFVGRAGQLLDAMLAAIALSRQSIYIANILKCRPPGNRDPNPTEVSQCSPYLLKQIELIQPKLIVALGRIAAHCLLGTTAPMHQMRGKHFTYQNIPLIVTFHPAYLLRNPKEKRLAWEDLQRIAATIHA